MSRANKYGPVNEGLESGNCVTKYGPVKYFDKDIFGGSRISYYDKAVVFHYSTLVNPIKLLRFNPVSFGSVIRYNSNTDLPNGELIRGESYYTLSHKVREVVEYKSDIEPPKGGLQTCQSFIWKTSKIILSEQSSKRPLLFVRYFRRRGGQVL